MVEENEKQILQEAYTRMQRTFGMTEKEFEKHVGYPHNRKIVIKHSELRKYRIVAEVIQSQYCSAGLQIGQKLVFKAVPSLLLPEESDCPVCLRAIGPLANLAAGFWDRIIDDRSPNDGMWNLAECLDPGLEKGGLGHVVFKVYARKADTY